jgi:FkbM family methyltransferase
MTMISYAQNFEDVILWRALKHVNNGFYIDIGANDPKIDSVTKWFYDQKWQGINIEPLDEHYADLCEKRPLDINIQCAIGEQISTLEIWECDIRGWATLDKNVAAEHEAKGHTGRWKKVPIRTLKNVLTDYSHHTDIHFMKIDVEGYEQQVIQSNDWSLFRPWILVIEATEPNTQIESYVDWEVELINNKYHFVFKDGINRYYIADEHSELDYKFIYPVNIFDDFIKIETVDAHTKNNALEDSIKELNSYIDQIKEDKNNLELQIECIYKSFSWKILSPIRYIFSKLKNSV